MGASRGFTLLETAVVLAIVALLAIALAAGGLQHPAAASTASAQFDAALAAARNLAANGSNGATLVITTLASGAQVRIYAGRPTSSSALTYSGIPDATFAAAISEANMNPPMTVFFNSHSAASEMSGTVAPGSTIATDPGCPGSVTSLVFTISDSRTSTIRAIPCSR